MMSPIGEYLTEFRAAGLRAFTPLLVEEPPSETLEAMDFGFGEDPALAFPPDAEGEEMPDEPDSADAAAPAPEAETGILPEAALEALKAEHAAELASARQQWVEDEGTALAARMAQCFDDLERKLADTLAPMLEPFLAKAAQVKVLDQLRDTLGTLLAGGDQRPVTITGPEDLIEAIKRAYPNPSSLVFQTADEPDVSIAMGDTRVRSQLRSWARKLDAALGTPR